MDLLFIFRLFKIKIGDKFIYNLLMTKKGQLTTGFISGIVGRWLFSTNAKDIGTLYLIFAVFAGMIGTAFSALIRLELSAPGVQFLQGDHQLFNVLLETRVRGENTWM